MRRVKRPVREDFTAREIARFTRLIRKILSVHGQKAPNLLVVFEQLKKVFPKLRLRVVENTELPAAEARAYPAYWIIKIRRGIFEGLLRGDVGARWTFAHELGHVLLQHPGKPFRMRAASGSNIVEQQAHIFAAQLLAPSDLAKKYKTAEEIALAFQISIEAARRRLSEIRLEERSKAIGSRRSPHLNRNETSHLEDLGALICSAISATIAENRLASISVEPWKNNLFSTSLLTAKAAQLLLDAHESVRSTSVESGFMRAACVASAIFTVGPIREIGSNNTRSEEITRLNELCALKATGSLLGFDFGNLDNIVSMNKFRNAGMAFSFDYLTSLIQRGDRIIAGTSTILHFRDLPLYYDYNENNDISWREVHALENLAKIFVLWKAGRPALKAD